ncbi:uncharacterized protein LOC123271268 [Cotesia glomerata]|uniref:uncharacterized protein LOC123271268 n=1 Tax=Cotesia glomerata TaxID=32391 RepID=UPI001D00FEE0|nr:uncharacterized protein LOC123271268 [Cotesia glomerata]
MSSESKNQHVYLVGFQSSALNKRKLPSQRQVLSVFFYNLNFLKQSVRESARNVLNEVNDIWSLTGIPVIKSCNAISKIVRLHNEWILLKKNKSRNTQTQKSKEKRFSLKLDQIFDLALQKSFNQLTETQKEFLSNERRAHRSSPIIFETNSQTDSDEELTRSFSGLSTSTGSKSFPSSGELKREISNFENELPSRLRPKKKKNVIDEKLVATLDRTQTSDRMAAYLVNSVAKNFDVDVDKINTSRSSLRRHRMHQRQATAKNLKEKIIFPSCLVLHWDGKLLDDSESVKKVERLPVIVTGLDFEHILGVPKLVTGDSKNQTDAIIKLLDEWKIKNKIKALCFDTAAVNTGLNNGTCTQLERELNRNLLHLGCRHHIYELVLRSVAETCWPVTSGPNVAIFNRFKNNWENINKEEFETGIEDSEVEIKTRDMKDEILQFISSQIKEYQPRADYKELLDLTYIFGRNSIKSLWIQATWSDAPCKMKQFKVNAKEIPQLRDICLFIVTIYVKAWCQCPNAIKAPNQDLQFLKDIIKYKDINRKISSAAMDTFLRHGWYLSESLAPLSFSTTQYLERLN